VLERPLAIKYRALLLLVIIAATVTLSLMLLSGWSSYSYAADESWALFPSIKVAWAGDDDDHGDKDDNNIPPLANGIPAKDLCVKCENSKNLIQGQGLIVGTNHEDFIQGSTENDQIWGKKVGDIIFADLGIDRVYGGHGGDTVEAGPGNDQIFGEGGDDQLFGGFDDDLIVGGRGNNHMFGDIGNDVLKGGDDSGANYFDCGEGLDVIIDFNPAKGDVTAGNCEIF
jgi:Ca2+-binding RTX toxin-like protein